MKKIGIVTLNGYNNHGNRLQNFALEYIIKSFGINVETIIFEDNIETQISKTNSLFSRFLTNIISEGVTKTVMKSMKWPYETLYSKLVNLLFISKINERKKKFINFSELYLNEVKYTNDDLKYHTLNKDFHSFIVGSDQVWNPYENVHKRYFYFLRFTSREKRIAYAASFGIKDFPEKFKIEYKEYLETFDSISVRESSGAKIIKAITKKNVNVLLDPTLLLSPNIYVELFYKKYLKSNEEYMLVNVLGKKSRKNKNRIIEIARKNKLKIIDISKPVNIHYKISPDEFISLIIDSKYIVTDSFHTCVFSYLFNKPFTVFSRDNINTRINELYDIIYDSSIEEFEEIDFYNYSKLETNKSFLNKVKNSLDFLTKTINNLES